MRPTFVDPHVSPSFSKEQRNPFTRIGTNGSRTCPRNDIRYRQTATHKDLAPHEEEQSSCCMCVIVPDKTQSTYHAGGTSVAQKT